MRRILHSLFVIIVLLATYFPNYAVEQITNFKSQPNSFTGRHFFFAFMENEIDYVIPNQPPYLKAYIFTENSTAHVTIKYQNVILDTIIKANSYLEYYFPGSLEIRLPPNPKLYQTTEIPINQSIEILSDELITVYGHSSQLTTSDMFTAVPISAWGTDYKIITMPNDHYYSPPGTSKQDSLINSKNRPGEFVIIASEDNTNVKFKLTAQSYYQKNPGSYYSVTLNKGECYMVQSSPTSLVGLNDLSGTIIKSDKPIGVIAGHSRTSILQKYDSIGDSKNYLADMMLPTYSWGKKYFSTSFKSTIQDYYKIVVKDSNTIIEYENANTGRIDYYITNPDSVLIVDGLSGPVIWTSNKQFAIAQFMKRDRIADFNSNYDPCMVILPAADQMISKASVFVPNASNMFIINGHYQDQYIYQGIIITCNQKAVNNLTLDGTPINFNKSFNSFGMSDPNTYYIEMQLTNGFHKLACDTGKFNAILYGLGSADAYSTVLGSSILNTLKQDTVPPKISAIDYNECGRIKGTITDNGTNDLGIFSVVVNEDSSYNYIWVVSPIYDSSKTVTINAMPKVPSKDARLTFKVLDKAGNGFYYNNYYTAIKIAIDSTALSYPNVRVNDTLYKKIKISNKGNRAFDIDSIYIGDSRIKILNISYPIQIDTLGILELIIRFAPGTDISDLNTQINIFFTCDIVKSIALKGLVSKPSLIPINHDYGNVRVGDTTYSDLKWVNNGNTTLKIDSIINIVNKVNFSQGNGFYPDSIRVGDTLTLNSVFFTPTILKVFQSTFKVFSDPQINDLENQLFVKGNGIAPKINSLTVDFKSRRIGTIYDTTVYLKNIGNDSIKIKSFTWNSLPSRITSILDSLNKITNIDIKADSSIPIHINFISEPIDSSGFNNSFNIITDWKFHLPTEINFLGKGIISHITTYDYNFDTVPINSVNKLSNSKLFKSDGTELLFIDNIRILEGDSSSFDLQNISDQKFYLIIDSFYKSNIVFKPTRTGYHYLKLAILNDALPNYNMKLDTILIQGYALPQDTLNLDLNLRDSNIYSCLKSKLQFEVKSKSNLNILINKIDVKYENKLLKSFTNIDMSNLAIYIDSIEITPQIQSGTNLQFFVDFSYKSFYYNKWIDSTIEKDYNLNLHVQKLQLVDSTFARYDIGEISNLEFSGSFPNDNVIPSNLSFNLFVDVTKILLFYSEVELILTDKNNQIKIYKMSAQQFSDKIEIFSLENENILYGFSSWKIRLKVLPLLQSDVVFGIKIQASDKNCFQQNEILKTIYLNEICNFGLRQIELLKEKIKVTVSPNPVSEFANIEIETPVNDQGKIEIFDVLGQKILSFQNLILQKGKQNIIFELNALSNGNYMLILNCRQFILSTSFIISK